jgi:hypothetical protein
LYDITLEAGVKAGVSILEVLHVASCFVLVVGLVAADLQLVQSPR